ncbi:MULTISPECIES: DUF1007 family protein [unclassified Roseovarius]|uniref:DUF1007 family protein n=1 Tax=unclassified Roseovarius TaxID=2614913 RepID=UPI00273F6B39|nr:MULTISPECIES: DUF1007 family protein [unclassified Roseovarius]
MMRRLGSLLLPLLLLQGPALAHPHIFVDAKAGFRFNDAGQVAGFRISWTYDAFTTLFLFDVLDLDRDGDGALDDADYAAILRGETEWQEGYVGDIYFEVNDTVKPHLVPVDAEALYRDELITIRFDLPLATPVDVAGQDVVLRLYDPNYYYAYTVAEITNATHLPDGCAVDLVPFEPDALTSDLLVALGSLSREEQPEQEGIGRMFSDEVILKCG